MSDSILRDKCFQFALKIVRFCLNMRMVQREFDISRQLLKSGTSPGALTREAQYAESRVDFSHKHSIGLKEANEADYWLDIIIHTFPELKKEALDLKRDCKEIIAMLVSTTKTLKAKR